MNRMICTAAALAVTLAFSWAAPAQPELSTDAPSWGPEILADPQAYSQHLKQSIREGKFTQFYFAVTKGSPVRLDKAMPRPWDNSILKDPSSASFRLTRLLEEGRLAEFYLQAREDMDAFRRILDENPAFSEKRYQDRLWMLYYIAAAPPCTIDDDPRIPSLPFLTKDYDMKHFALFNIGFEGSSDEDYLRYEREHRKELLHLFASYSAGVLKAVRNSYDPGMKEKIKKMRYQFRKEDDNETDKLKFQFFSEKKIMKSSRNSTLPHQIKWMEELVVKSLLYYFPGKPREVERYIRMAGYREEEEIDELIYRTVGRVPESECLFKGDRGKRYERKLHTGAVSHVNDRYMHPLDLVLRDGKQKNDEEKKKEGKSENTPLAR